MLDPGLFFRVLSGIVLQDVFGNGLERLRAQRPLPQIDRAGLREFIELQPLHDLVGLLLHHGLLDFGLERQAPGMEGVLGDHHVAGRPQLVIFLHDRRELQPLFEWRPRLVDEDAALVTGSDRLFDEVW